MNQTLASIRDVAVRYGATTALDGVSLDLLAGEVHALVGENGAGKSTLLRVLSGARQPDEGQVGHPPGIRVAWVPQEPDLPPDLTVEEAVYLGAELCHPGGWLRRRAMRDGARALLTQVGSSVEPALRAGSLSAPQRKQVQIAQALRHNPDVLLLDEPTAVLGAHETARLFAILAQRRRDGQATVYVSHRLDEVMQVADRVTVLRDGVRVSTDLAHAVTPDDLVTRMVGRTVPARQRIDRRHGAEAVRLTHVSAGAARDVSLAVRRGEIVGLAGLMGAGRSDLLEAIAGLQPVRHGTIDRAAAAVLLPADRGRNGLVPPFSVRENLFLPAPRFWLDRRRECRDAAAWIDRLRIRTASVEAPIDSLSGGNQQKLLLARALRHQPQVFLLDEPTAGIDIGAKAEIHAEIVRLADAGMAVLLASSELLELLLLCDRILAMYAGHIVGEVSAADATEAYLATLITGAGTVSGAGCRVSGVEPR